MRQPTDLCLHCRVNQATKANSHILPRFISTNFLGVKGAPRRGYALDAGVVHGGKSKIVQDSPKENYILCEECELYFSLLESYSAPTFNKWAERVSNKEFEKIKIAPDLSVVECKSSNANIIRLLVYSMFWRVSISSHLLFEDYKLSPKTEESLRNALVSIRALNLADLIVKLLITCLPEHPYSVFTSETFKDETANTLAAINPYNPASLNVDRFGFMLFEDVNDIKIAFLRDFSNAKLSDCRFMILSEQLWHTLMVKAPIELVVEQGKLQKK